MAAPSGRKNRSAEKLEVGTEGEIRGRGVGVPRMTRYGNRDNVGAMLDTLEDFRRQWKDEINNQNLGKGAASKGGRSIWQGCSKTSWDANNNNADAASLQTALSNMGGAKKFDGHCAPGELEESDDNGEDECSDCGSGIRDDRPDRSDDDGESLVSITVDSLVCKPATNQEATHISDLPVEVLNLIFKWVVSSHLDVDSLERLSVVCKGFYILARDEDLWKSICVRTWEKITLQPDYLSYRQMFIERPHVMFNGCYISKSTYFRQGENSFDGYNRPFQVVKYYRYIRFYPEGKVYMFMSPEQPRDAVAHLKNNSNYVQGLQYGYYKLTDDKVSLVLKKIPEPSVKLKRYARNSRYSTDHEQTFCMEMSLKTVGWRRNLQLSWVKYFMHNINKTTGESTTMTFDISANMYPPFFFTPVRSFSAQSDSPL